MTKLLLIVHGWVLSTSPKAYLTALWWRVCGKRLRARGQFAKLFGRSPKAYELWMAQRRNAPSSALIDGGSLKQHSSILALVDLRTGDGDARRTLESLSAQSVPALLIGTTDIPGLADAARHLASEEAYWVMPLIAGDEIAVGAAAAYSGVLVEASARVIYADDDLLDKTGHRTKPHFKPDWNSELFGHFDYLSGASLLRITRADLESLADGDDWAARLTARLVAGEGALHIRRMVHHRRARPAPHVPIVCPPAPLELPMVSIIIPTRNRLDLLRTCLEGVAATDYPSIETIIVDNDSDDPQTIAFLDGLDPARCRVLRHPGLFNYSAINNHAVQHAQGQLLCLLNNDIEITDPDWLSIMAVQALRDDVGAVGARLLYPDGRIQHAGVIIGVGNAAGHAHRFLRADEEGYFHRHSLPQFVSAVTAACLVVGRERFLTAGGLDERNFAVAFNDVDLCLRLNQKGWQSLYEPRATMIHHESVSRGFDKDPAGAARFAGELAALQRFWNTGEVVDPFHHPELSRASEQFVLGLMNGR